LSVFLNGLVKFLPPNQTNHISAESEKKLRGFGNKRKNNEDDANSEGRQTGLDKSKAIRSSIEIISNNKAIAVQETTGLRVDP